MSYRDDLLYSLAKRIPDMERGFTISTNYGSICIEPDQALPIILAVKAALIKELNACPTETPLNDQSS